MDAGTKAPITDPYKALEKDAFEIPSLNDWVETKMGSWRKPGTYFPNGQPTHQTCISADWTAQQRAVADRASAKRLLLKIIRKGRQDLLILFATKASSQMSKFLLERIMDYESFEKALKIAEQWEKSKVGVATVILNVHEISFGIDEIKEEPVEAVGRPRFRRGNFGRRGNGRFQRRVTYPTMPTEAKKGKCFSCGREGHFGREYRIKPRNSKTGRFIRRGRISEINEDEEKDEEGMDKTISVISRLDMNEI